MIDPNIARKTFMEVSIDINAVATYYPGMIKVYVPNIPIRKLLPDWEAQTDKYAPINADKTSAESDLERSIRRSQKTVNDLVLCNRFDLFATLTIAKDRYNPIRSKNKVHNWLKYLCKKYGKFPYILVPEYHKDGAFHFHVLIANFPGELKQSFNIKTGKPLIRNGKEVYEFPEFTSGFTKVQYIGQSADDHAKVGNYIRKYITKEMVTIFGQKRYWTSKGLNRPAREDNPQWYLETTPDDVYENDYGKILTYTDLSNKILPAYIILLTGEDRL
jgi:hypothetical protein